MTYKNIFLIFDTALLEKVLKCVLYFFDTALLEKVLKMCSLFFFDATFSKSGKVAKWQSGKKMKINMRRIPTSSYSHVHCSTCSFYIKGLQAP
jgi:hypothetical protein